jgi:multidrug resistance protein
MSPEDNWLPPFTAGQSRLILLLISFAGLIGPLASNIYFPALIDIKTSLDTSETLVNATISVFIFFYGVFPVFWASFSDIYGRRTIYILSTGIFTVASILCAVSVNIWMLMVCRALQAAGASAIISVGAGTIGDVFPIESRGTAMGIFFMGPSLGPLIGPVAGGYLNEYLGWRWIFWILTMLGAVITLTMLLWLPETLKRLRMQRVIQERIKQEESAIGLNDTPAQDYSGWMEAYTVPGLSARKIVQILVMPLTYLTHPGALLSIMHLGAVFASLYAVTSTMPRTFTALYGLSSSQIGLTYLSYSLGTLTGSFTSGRFIDMVLRIKKQDVESVPAEYRLFGAYIGGVITPLALLMYGLFTYYKLSLWIVLIATFLTGFGTLWVMTSCSVFLVDLFPGKSASAVSVNNLVRNVFTAISTAVAIPLLDALGAIGFFSLMAGLCVVTGVGVAVVFFMDAKWHSKWLEKHS